VSSKPIELLLGRSGLWHTDSAHLPAHAFEACHAADVQASTQGLVKELQKEGRAQGARVLCPVPLVTEGLIEPPVVPKFLEALQASVCHDCCM